MPVPGTAGDVTTRPLPNSLEIPDGDMATAKIGRTRAEHDCTVVTVTGAVDARSEEQMRAALEDQPEPGTGVLVADWSRVSFCSSGGVRLLLDLRERARRAGVPLALVADCTAVRRPLEALGLRDQFCWFRNRDDAVRAAAMPD